MKVPFLGEQSKASGTDRHWEVRSSLTPVRWIGLGGGNVFPEPRTIQLTALRGSSSPSWLNKKPNSLEQRRSYASYLSAANKYPIQASSLNLSVPPCLPPPLKLCRTGRPFEERRAFGSPPGLTAAIAGLSAQKLNE